MFKKKWSASLVAIALAVSITTINEARADVQLHRIVSLSPTATEDLFAIGAGPQVIAVDQLSNYPTTAPISKLDAFTPNVEAIAAYKPDLVILNSGATKAESIKSALKKLKIKVYYESAPQDMTGAYKQITELGSLTGRGAAAQKLVRSMQKSIATSIKSAKKSIPISIYHELDDTLYSVTSETFIGKVYKDFNLVNIADAAAKADSYGYPQLTPEYIVKSSPSIIYLSDAQYGTTAASVGSRAGWSTIKAVTAKHIVALPDDIPSRWGPRMVDFYQFVAKSLTGVSA